MSAVPQRETVVDRDGRNGPERPILPIQPYRPEGAANQTGVFQVCQQVGLTFQSKAMQGLIRQAARYADSSAAILITGESGTGKEVLSRFIHQQSRRGGEFVSVNCAALPELLFESELFGHDRGAFTGAVQNRSGYFELAHGGTLLLDEISEIPPNLQAKLLRVIEEREFQRIGSTRSRKIDVRILATSNRDLRREAQRDRFRLDLYHRLNVLHLHLPPIRERTSDIPALVSHFIKQFRAESRSEIRGISNQAMQRLCRHDWPGNIRELRNVMHRACILCDGDTITEECLTGLESVSDASAEGVGTLEGLTLAEAERELILACLRRHGDQKKSAAEELGVTPRTLSNKLKLYRDQGWL